ncbi:MAG: NUDIX domain-containing protein [Asgard group archaeon]|jgi:8-oxo-dGTP pyrophosphatase MutT (NUDIX family)|nr:NUDIX domain-containing protein [Asgard group archaeon]|tara:strand:+ start:1615 stop:2067 length:453 start_codon:yes stop_codon:yes gene_type:complete
MARKTKKEFSAGFVVFYKKNLIDDKCELLLLDHGSHISHPKGHIEKGETKIQTAIRELKEETNLSPYIFSKTPIKIIKYRIKRPNFDINKTVYFFATITKEGEIKISNEHKRFILVDINSKQAINTITYDQDKSSFKEALTWYEENKNNL